MTQREKLEILADGPEERMLLAKILDRVTSAQRRNIPAFTGFLSLREQELVRRLVGQTGLQFYGGYEQAERRIAAWLPDYLPEAEPPIACLCASYYPAEHPSHRDFLGSLMGMGIKREVLGDICVCPGRCDLFLLAEMAPYVLQNFTSAGRTRLHVEEIPLSQAQAYQPETKPVHGTVSSLRLDSILAVGFQISRGQAAQRIAAGAVAVDGAVCTKADRILDEGVRISVRGLGKIRLRQISGLTRKGRTGIELERYI